jgi:hypothetical protein
MPLYLIVFGFLIYFTISWRKKNKKLSKNDRFMVISVFLLGAGLIGKHRKFFVLLCQFFVFLCQFYEIVD